MSAITRMGLLLLQIATPIVFGMDVPLNANAKPIYGVYSVEHQTPSYVQRIQCSLSRCAGLRGSQFDVCYATRCGGGSDDTNSQSACVLDNCGHYAGFFQDVCAFAKCNSGSRNDVIEVQRRWNYDEMVWPDEFETRSVGSHRVRKEAETGRPVKSQGCSTICHGYNGRKYEKCMAENCHGAAKSSPLSLTKRWSGRLCMEAHCNHAANKAEYFMCGQTKCRR